MPPSIELRQHAKRPPIHLVAREGDPLPAVAMALAHDQGPEASAALAGLLEHRLHRRGLRGVEVVVHGLGLEVQQLVQSPDDAARVVNALMEALEEPVASDAPELQAARQRVEALQAQRWAGPYQRQLADCSGEAGVLPEAHPTVDSAADLERWRTATHSTHAAALAAVGPQKVLDAAAKAVGRSRPWPANPTPEDKWPGADRVGADVGLEDPRLSVALRVSDGGQALAAARLLGADPTLGRRLETLDPGWAVERITSTLRPRGACLRVDLTAPDGPEPGPETIATAARIAIDELERSLSTPGDPAFALRQALLSPSDPRDAAGAAAWQALASQLKAGPTRRYVIYTTQPDGAVPPLKQALRHIEQSWDQTSIEIRERLETGQGELWALLASPCGTTAENPATAGQAGLAMRALATGAPEVDGVVIEPWITADGVGLLAHGPRIGPTETAAEHASRIGEALGRSLTRPMTGPEVARARAETQAALGPGPRPDWWLAIHALAPDHPSWLVPQGTWGSVAEATTHGVVDQRGQLVAGPLRLAVIANVTDAQAALVAQGADRWLQPLRADPSECPPATQPTARVGQLEIETTPGPGTAAAHVGVALPLRRGVSEEAHYTLWLLNRPGGWLDQALQRTGLVASARAHLLGGRRASALVVTLEAAPEQTEPAVAQLRALFERLAQGAVSKRDFLQARREFGRGAARSTLEPRRRVVDLWQTVTPEPPTLASLQAFHARVFPPDRHLVVIVKQRP